MPLVPTAYRAPVLFRNGHIATVYSGLVRRVNGVHQERERITLPDGDFLDLDWSFATTTSDKVVILLHGLEGNAQRPYITGSAKQFNQAQFDACAVNLRGCSGEPNRLYRSYHSGASEDLEAVIQHILSKGKYHTLVINGFSLGGNLALKYLGEGNDVPKEVKAAIAISVPCSLHSSLIQLMKPKNKLYSDRFRRHLKAKLRIKQPLFPERITNEKIDNIKTLKDFDNLYTSDAHGFADALDYYEKCSSLQFLPQIQVPSLIINALNDSFFGIECYPYQEADDNPKLYLETPKHGGHVGFYSPNNEYYNEKRAVEFVEELIPIIH